MTTKETVEYLGKSKAWIYGQARKATIRTTLSQSGETVWNDSDVTRMRVLLDYGVEKDWDWAKQYTVIYCRTEPVSDLPSATQRLLAQRERMLNFSIGRGLDPDIILTEVRPILRYGSTASNPAMPQTPVAMQALLGLLSEGKVRTLIIETRDRLCSTDSWFLYETLLRQCGVKEIIVANQVWPTKEQVVEAKGWMTDLLARYKVLAGEIKDQSTIDVFMKGYDPKQTFLYTCKLEAKLTQREKAKRKPQWAKLGPDKRVLDLDDCWATDSDLLAEDGTGTGTT